MKNKCINIFLGGCVLLLFSFKGCTNSPKCQSNKVGEAFIDISSKSFLELNNQNNIVFESAAGQQMIFDLEVQHRTNNRSCYNYLCKGFTDPFQGQPCEYIDTESYVNLYRDQNNQYMIETKVVMEPNQEESDYFYDLYSLHFSKIGLLSKAQKALYAHHPSIDLSSIYYVQEPFIYLGAKTLNGTAFNEVFKTNNTNLESVYISKTKGVIAFTLEPELFVRSF